MSKPLDDLRKALPGCFHPDGRAIVASARLPTLDDMQCAAARRRLAVAQRLADALKEICTALAGDDEWSARQIARHAGAKSLAEWEQTR